MHKKIWHILTKNRPSKENAQSDIENTLVKIPDHLAIIMDGNGRWAKKRGMPRGMGHRAGVETLRDTVTACGEIGIKVLTVYAFSTENWQRPSDEVNLLMDLLVEYLSREMAELNRKNVQVRTIGLISDLPHSAKAELEKAVEVTRNNTGIIFNLALNYGGRDEIIRAAKAVVIELTTGKLRLEDLGEDEFAGYLYTAGLPDPDLIIRTSGEMRLSNYLLWQAAYSEFYITDVLWPDFDRTELIKALMEYQKRNRRYGGL